MNKAVVLAVFAAAAAARAAAADIAPGVLVSGDGRVVYARVPPGRLEAREVAGGALLWRTAEDLRPLAERGSRLLCQRGGPAGRLDLPFLDTKTGRVLDEARVALPAGVAPLLDEGLGTRFRLRSLTDGPRTRLEWTFERRPVRGAHFEAERETDGEVARVLRAAGAAIVDLDSGWAETAPAASAPVAGGLPALGGTLREGPLRIGGYVVATASEGRRPSLLRRTAAGETLPPVALPAGVTLQTGSADGRHVLASREVPGAPRAEAHQWTVLDLATGERHAALRTSVASAPFELAGGSVLLVLEAWGHRAASGWRDEPRLLRAFTPSGAAAWSEPLQDPSYRGPVAP